MNKEKIYIAVESMFVLIYLGMGIYLILKPNVLTYFGATMQIAFALLVIAYALYRAFRLIKKLKNNENQNPN